MKIAVKAVGLVKSFGDLTAVNHVNINVEEGNLVTFLGPSGCGKTTLLRMIAGLLNPDEGEITIDDQVVFSRPQGINMPSEERDIGMVFQSYAIWPHYTVFENIAYPLKIRKFSKSEIKEKVTNVLSMVRMEGMADRYPGELSGGQQQRVALVRAVVYSPRLLLLDEPLANLDAVVRENVRFEIKELQRQTKVTSIYVTHDQAEAMVLSDKVIVINDGELIQEGVPFEIYSNPQSEFVASFIGMSNFIDGECSRVEQNRMIVKTSEGNEIRCVPSDRMAPGNRVLLCIRPEDFELHANPPKEDVNVLEARIKKSAFLGNIVNYWVEVGGRTLRVQAHPSFDRERQGDTIFLRISEEQIKVIESEQMPVK